MQTRLMLALRQTRTRKSGLLSVIWGSNIEILIKKQKKPLESWLATCISYIDVMKICFLEVDLSDPLLSVSVATYSHKRLVGQKAELFLIYFWSEPFKVSRAAVENINIGQKRSHRRDTVVNDISTILLNIQDCIFIVWGHPNRRARIFILLYWNSLQEILLFIFIKEILVFDLATHGRCILIFCLTSTSLMFWSLSFF